MKVNISGTGKNKNRYTTLDSLGRLIFPRKADNWTSNHAYGIPIYRSNVLKYGEVLNILKKNPHPNIANILDYDDDNVYLEYIDGIVLSNVNKFTPDHWKLIPCYLDINNSINFNQIKSAVKHLHINNVAHTDITTFNVMVDKNGVCKLIDMIGAMPLTSQLEKLDLHLLNLTRAELINNYKNLSLSDRDNI